MKRVIPRWTVKKKNGYWVVFDRGVAWDCEDLKKGCNG